VLRGEKVTLRAITREDLPRLLDFWNDVEVELAGGGDPPNPCATRRISRSRPKATLSATAACTT
jgi:hypothetical protein